MEETLDVECQNSHTEGGTNVPEETRQKAFLKAGLERQFEHEKQRLSEQDTGGGVEEEVSLVSRLKETVSSFFNSDSQTKTIKAVEPVEDVDIDSVLEMEYDEMMSRFGGIDFVFRFEDDTTSAEYTSSAHNSKSSGLTELRMVVDYYGEETFESIFGETVEVGQPKNTFGEGPVILLPNQYTSRISHAAFRVKRKLNKHIPSLFNVKTNKNNTACTYKLDNKILRSIAYRSYGPSMTLICFSLVFAFFANGVDSSSIYEMFVLLCGFSFLIAIPLFIGATIFNISIYPLIKKYENGFFDYMVSSVFYGPIGFWRSAGNRFLKIAGAAKGFFQVVVHPFDNYEDF